MKIGGDPVALLYESISLLSQHLSNQAVQMLWQNESNTLPLLAI